MIEMKDGGRRQAPGWLMFLILLLCLGGAGVLTWYLLRPTPKRAPIVEDVPQNGRGQWPGPGQGQGQRQRPGPRPNGPPDMLARVKGKFTGGNDGIDLYIARNGYKIKAGSLIVKAIDPNAPKASTAPANPPAGPVQFAFTFVPLWSELLTQEEFELHGIAENIASGNAAAANAKADPQQIQQLRAAIPVLKVDAADQTRLRALLNVYVSSAASDKDQAGKAVVAAVQGILSAHLSDLKQAGAAEVATLKQVLRPEQLAAVRQPAGGGAGAGGGGGAGAFARPNARGNPPTTRPAGFTRAVPGTPTAARAAVPATPTAPRIATTLPAPATRQTATTLPAPATRQTATPLPAPAKPLSTAPTAGG